MINKKKHQDYLNLIDKDGTSEKVDLERIKLAAEIEKIQHEIKEQAKPFYFKPTFLSLFLPLMVPLVTFMAYYFMGGGKEYFDVKAENLKHDQYKIELQNKRLNYLSELRQKEFQRSQREMELKYERKENLLLGKRDSLMTIVTDLGDKKNQLSNQVAGLTNDVKNQALYVKLQLMRIDSNSSSYSPGIPDLISLVQSDPGRWEKLLIDEMKNDRQPVTRFKEFIILLKGTGKTIYLDSMFAIAGQMVKLNGKTSGYYKDYDFWVQLGCQCDFDQSSKVEIVKRVIALIKNYHTSSQYTSVMLYGLTYFPDKSFNLSMIDKDVFLDLIRIIRSNLFTGSNSKLNQDYSTYFTAASEYAPFAFAVFFSTLIDKEDVIEFQLKRHLSYMMQDIARSNRDLAIPDSTEVQQWRDWKRNNSSLVDIWMEPGLDSLQKMKELDVTVVGRNWRMSN